MPQGSIKFKDGKFYGITPQQKIAWKEAYPQVDVELELKQMAQWLMANKPKKYYHKFIVNWLSRNQRNATTVNKLAGGLARRKSCIICKQPVRYASSGFCDGCGNAYDRLSEQIWFNGVKTSKEKLPMWFLEPIILKKRAELKRKD